MKKTRHTPEQKGMPYLTAISIRVPWLFLILLCGASTAYGQTAQYIAQKAFRSTVLLVMEDASGHPLSLGSGFYVKGGQIASNLHVVKGAARGWAKLIGERTRFRIKGITAVDPKRDLVLLKISGGGHQNCRSEIAILYKSVTQFLP